ncbi:alpha/beta hydrolase [Cellulophaga sp. HaHaR_3_176]|uniref:alpha/beta hydrolase n=1 Tax=Cellulophaga sp. HaHaR_3_176 TaxID=1942464 RepID=UPI001C1FA886|nr:alpha/beta hydrolase [Cellulophaga sp. HaHaR_3_176]QWX82776.1 alpha/beta hydrolase [Cellulophaga sp. HaHaR_3_176]
MKKNILFLVLLLCFSIVSAQQLVLKKGTVIDSVKINDSIAETFALYLPTNFDVNKKWPIVFLFDVKKGEGKKTSQMFVNSAEKEGYIIATSNSVRDSLTLSENILIASRLMNNVLSILPIDNNRIYTAGFADSGRFASVLPILIKNIKGVISLGGAITNTDVLNAKSPFHYIGIVSVDDYNLLEMEANEKVMNLLGYPNQLFVYDNKLSPTLIEYIDKALDIFTLRAMANGDISKDSVFLNTSFKNNIALINKLINKKKFTQSYSLSVETQDVYRTLFDIDTLKSLEKRIRKDKLYKTMDRSQSTMKFSESLLREDYDYSIYEDTSTYNFNNLGWWNYQMQELNKHVASNNPFERQMGNRLIGFLSYLVDSYIADLNVEKVKDEEGLTFLWMLKTIIDSDNFEAYKSVISYSAKNEDYSTSLYYLEELLKSGFKNKKEIYAIENTALLRITPEFNDLVEQYLKDSRYDLKER